MTTSNHARCVDRLDYLLKLCDVLHEVQLMPDGGYKDLCSIVARLQVRTLLFVLLLPAPQSDTVTTYDHHKEARHN